MSVRVDARCAAIDPDGDRCALPSGHLGFHNTDATAVPAVPVPAVPAHGIESAMPPEASPGPQSNAPKERRVDQGLVQAKSGLSTVERLLVVGIVVAAALGAYMLLDHRGQPTPSPSTASRPTKGPLVTPAPLRLVLLDSQIGPHDQLTGGVVTAPFPLPPIFYSTQYRVSWTYSHGDRTRGPYCINPSFLQLEEESNDPNALASPFVRVIWQHYTQDVPLTGMTVVEVDSTGIGSYILHSDGCGQWTVALALDEPPSP